MTGEEHYREAERLLADASGYHPGVSTADKLAEAQVHATLALAAAAQVETPNRPWWRLGGAR